MIPWCGSSPLARGLQRGPRPPRRAGRIIPARAGFTEVAPGGVPGAADHPRSRGVYKEVQDKDGKWKGSSPLARGLPRPGPSGTAGQGIIPARAGFTPPRRRACWRRWDHPRSRGVYPCGADIALQAGGIIPARAGFTFLPGSQRRVIADHPRSRGVYRPSQRTSHRPMGSSPLARGLPSGGVDPVQPGRIIPARAGFTLSPMMRIICGKDHPRSRGVYKRDDGRGTPPRGSSPLARGLRQPCIGT